MKAVVPICLGARRDLRSDVLSAALDVVLLDFKAPDAGKIGWLVIGLAAPAERGEVLGRHRSNTLTRVASTGSAETAKSRHPGAWRARRTTPALAMTWASRSAGSRTR